MKDFRQKLFGKTDLQIKILGMSKIQAAFACNEAGFLPIMNGEPVTMVPIPDRIYLIIDPETNKVTDSRIG